PVVEQGPGDGGHVRPFQAAPLAHQAADLVDVGALGLLLLDGVEQPWRALLLGGGDREEVAAAPPPGVDGIGDLAAGVEPEVPGRLAVGRVQDRVVDDDGRHQETPSECGSVYLHDGDGNCNRPTDIPGNPPTGYNTTNQVAGSAATEPARRGRPDSPFTP